MPSLNNICFHIFCNNQLYYNMMWWWCKRFGLWPSKWGFKAQFWHVTSMTSYHKPHSPNSRASLFSRPAEICKQTEDTSQKTEDPAGKTRDTSVKCNALRFLWSQDYGVDCRPKTAKFSAAFYCLGSGILGRWRSWELCPSSLPTISSPASFCGALYRELVLSSSKLVKGEEESWSHSLLVCG
jgi:hypothetical protein